MKAVDRPRATRSGVGGWDYRGWALDYRRRFGWRIARMGEPTMGGFRTKPEAMAWVDEWHAMKAAELDDAAGGAS